MTPIDGLAILALVGYALYRQTQISEVTSNGRFKLALIYGIIGICVGGFNPPSGVWGVAILVGSLALSVVIGLRRGHLTKLWVEPDGRIFKQGTTLTVALFLAMIVAKFGLGTLAYFTHIDDGEGFGEVLVMIALMVAIQAEIVHRRAGGLTRPPVPHAEPLGPRTLH